MANIKTLFLGLCALAGLAQAAPIADVTLTNTVTHTAYKTKVCMATVWLPAGQSPIAPTSTSGQSTTFRTSSVRPSSASVPVKENHTYSPSPAPTTSIYVPPPPPTTSAYVPPPAPTTSVYVAPTTPPQETTQAPVPVPEPTAPAYTPPAPVTTESPAYVAPAPPSTEVPVPVPEPTTSVPPPAETSPASQPGQFVEASAANSCEGTSAACEGDVTHYDGGLGACGWDVNTESDLAIALPVGFMGAQSNGNPYCGRTVSIKNPNSGTVVQAKVGDKCMGCEGRAIDLTNKLFEAVTDGTGDGRESGYQWWFD